ncbi:MAG: S8 family serine peptidase [Acetobacteraceae bacterium]|nr:S8 family serine peptidase [Acetobacteraceae bacterium]
MLFHDRDADGIRDAGEEGLGGRTIFIDRNGNGSLDPDEASTITAADGQYSFSGLGPGIVRVADVAEPGWTRTSPATSLRVTSGFERSDFGLGTVRTASISGVKFEDLDGDGMRDEGELGLAGWTIFLDLNGDGILQPSEPSVLTGEDGTYRFVGLLPGTYIVAEVQRAGWVQTTPTGSGAGSGPLVTLAGSTVELTMEGCTCGGSWAVPVGSGLADLGAISTRSARELTGLSAALADPRFSRLSGAGVRTVLIDTGIDLDHPFFGPDRDGDGVADRIVFHWDFADDDADASDLPKGHGSHVASLIAGEDARYLGVAPGTELIVLKVFSDTGRGTFGNVEKALQWVIANAEAWNIGVVNLSLGDNGNWNAALSRYGLGDEFAVLAGLDVITVAASGNFYNQYNTLGVAYPAADPAVLAVGAVWTGDFGGPFTIATGATDFSTGVDRIAAFTQRSDTMLDILAPGARFNGANARGGVQTMQGTSQAAGFVSGAAALAQQLAQEVLGRRLNAAEFAALLQRSADWVVDGDDEHDNVRNTGLSFPRIQFVRLFEEIVSFRSLPSGGPGVEDGGGAVVVRPQEAAAAGVHTVSVASGANAVGYVFGNFRRAEIGGVVFEDGDLDGVRDPGETGLAGRIVFVDVNGNGLRDPDEAFAETAADGSFSLGAFGPGAINIRQVLPDGWFATTPQPATVAPTSGAAIVLILGATPNRPPVAVSDHVTLLAESETVLDVLANDSDPDGDPLTILSLPPRTEAGAVLRLEARKVVVDPRGVAAFRALPAGAEATDAFDYVIGDGRGGHGRRSGTACGSGS